jgi:acetyl-CoA carboxylase alpha subunit
MSQEGDIIESFQVLDFIKLKLNEIFIKGIDSLSNENNSSLIKLTQKLDNMNFSTLSKRLESFLEKMKRMTQKPVPMTLKKDISKDILEIITIARILERIMTLEYIKKTLKKGD